MGERKVINKYYPHDLDPSKIPRRRRPKNDQIKVRMMLPMTLRCAACGEYLGRGTKFNARKEDAAGERYLGAIQVFRFYIRCPRCSAEIAFKTDPGNSDYAVESGATRSLEPWRGAAGDDEAAAPEGGGDVMAALEGRARSGRREMDADAALEEARSLSARRARVAPAQALESLHNRCRRVADGRDALRELEQEADEALVKSIRFRNAAGYLKRIEEEDDREDEEEDFLAASLAKTVDAKHQAHEKKRPVVIVSKRRCTATAAPAEGKARGDDLAETSEGKASAGGALQALCCSYDDASDDEES
ncbi:hypothetical protein C2845_PM07G13910 [Panicum miliaceum]|uniref:Splicing factor YJU2 n=1 Tax=Panicum miliaceum TaxID=4540 RepID=A0A3L6SSQ0_PANMI|nr:hypothetical protein C2845_PM07G13910 [Panicum miliaceum]